MTMTMTIIETPTFSRKQVLNLIPILNFIPPNETIPSPTSFRMVLLAVVSLLGSVREEEEAKAEAEGSRDEQCKPQQAPL